MKLKAVVLSRQWWVIVVKSGTRHISVERTNVPSPQLESAVTVTNRFIAMLLMFLFNFGKQMNDVLSGIRDAPSCPTLHLA